MNLYPYLRPLLFQLDAETAHHLTLDSLKTLHSLGLSPQLPTSLTQQPVTVMGLTFDNPVGLAAGLDKNGDYIDALAGMGFGFIEIGTVTPRPQDGNPKPRLFRLPEHRAIINRMGFNNLGIDHLLAQVERSHYRGVIGINIGKNADTAMEDAIADYRIGLQKSYRLASYITLNISSPNTKNLRDLQQGDAIKQLLETLKTDQQTLQTEHGKYTPLVVKIAPDLDDAAIQHIAELLLSFEMDGVIATNTTLDRQAVQGHRYADEAGGLSGAPVKHASTRVVKALAEALNGKLPIIAAGGILSAADAEEKRQAGAQLVQIYSGLIYQGPQLITDMLSEFKAA